MLTINVNQPVYAMPVTATKLVQAPLEKADPAKPLDPIDISSFSREDRNTDAGVKDPNKKSFKNMKDYIQYMLLMYAKLRDLKAGPNEIYAKIEDQPDLAKTKAAIDNAELV